MSSQKTLGKVAGGSKRPNQGPKESPSARARGSAGGQNNKVHEILTLVERLNIGSLKALEVGLLELGLFKDFKGSESSHTRPIFESAPDPHLEAPSEVGGVTVGSPSVTGPQGITPPSKEGKPSDEGSGTTRRTMIRKARKSLKDSLGNAEGTSRALTRLRFLADKYETSLESLLPSGFELPSGDPGANSDSESSEEEEPIKGTDPHPSSEVAGPVTAPVTPKGKGPARAPNPQSSGKGKVPSKGSSSKLS